AIHPADAARVVGALDKVGQPATARAFAGDVARAHLLMVMRDSGEVMPIAMVDAAVEAAADETAAGGNGIEAEITEVADEGTSAFEEDAAAADTDTDTGTAETDAADATAETNAETTN
ncbi:MAG: hypothetical protein VXZ74_03725, partial [Pseudomonadota bacterium]|nr:hypothetical protein [Pseudomonadota bacterium]